MYKEKALGILGLQGMVHLVRSTENELGDYIGTKDLVKVCGDATKDSVKVCGDGSKYREHALGTRMGSVHLVPY